MDRETLIAVIGGVFGIAVAVLGPFAANWVKRMANGRVQTARERSQFYRDLQTRLTKIEEQLVEEQRKNLELERTLVQVEELAKDLSALREMMDEHLKDHPHFDRMMALVETMTIRMGRGVA